eukprot:TRINITY_DN16226_c0_g1_i1.p2 TRINITY_DN16226_c0_g1~~TRINITY_DN16226_c0_g1_i1.p2  ORF type:complete len:162 (-),score=5.79 TRINITY_DN16226_c0_g1_i1:49-534(-)
MGATGGEDADLGLEQRESDLGRVGGALGGGELDVSVEVEEDREPHVAEALEAVESRGGDGGQEPDACPSGWGQSALSGGSNDVSEARLYVADGAHENAAVCLQLPLKRPLQLPLHAGPCSLLCLVLGRPLREQPPQRRHLRLQLRTPCVAGIGRLKVGVTA